MTDALHGYQAAQLGVVGGRTTLPRYGPSMRSHPHPAFFAVVSLLACAVLTCQDQWQGLGGGANDRVVCLVHDEIGDRVYVAGDFSQLGATVSSKAGVWNGTAWTALGAAFSATPEAITRSAAGEVYIAAGTLGDSTTSRVYRLSGTSWVAHGNGTFAGPVRGLAVDGDTVYATGSFLSVGGRSASNVAACVAGGDWNGFGGGLNGEGHSVSVMPGGGVIAVGGDFTQAGSVPANRVALWEGSAWFALGAGTNDRVRAVQWTGTIVDPILHVAGHFTQAGSVAATGVARYASGVWTGVGTRSTGAAYALFVRADNNLVVGHGTGVDVWNGTSWTPRLLGNQVSCLWYDADGDIYVGGSFTTGAPYDRLARWDPTPPTASVSVPSDTAFEGGSQGLFRLALGNSEPADVRIGLTVAGTATVADATLPAYVTVPAGTTTIDVPLVATNDVVAESDESVILTVNASGSGYTVGAPNSATAWIRDDDTGSQPEVTVTVTAPAAGEGSGNGTIRLVLSAPAAAPLTVSYQLSGTAINGTDYALLSGSASFGVGASAVNLTIQPTNDALTEGAETASVTVVTGTGYVVGNPAYGTVVIADDEAVGITPTVALVALDTLATEGSDTASFSLSVNLAQTIPLVVHFTRAGTASQGTDYATIGTASTIPAGSNSEIITVVTLNDALVESVETVTLALATDAAYVIGGPASSSISILDDDATTPVVTMDAPDFDATEGLDSGTIVVTLTPAPTVDLTIPIAFFGSAQPNIDYTHNVTFTWPAGTASQTFTITALADAELESDEEVRLSAQAGLGYTLGWPSTNAVTIHNRAPVPPGGGASAASGDSGGGGGGCGGGAIAVLLACTLFACRLRKQVG